MTLRAVPNCDLLCAGDAEHTVLSICGDWTRLQGGKLEMMETLL